GLDYDWETCMTINGTWGYKSYDHNWKSTEKLIKNLVDIASKGGNYLLNVGPTSLGEIPQPSIERLKEIGLWMKVNGEAIYATTASPFSKLTWGRCTKKVRDKTVTLYLHVFDWPKNGKLLVPGLRSQVLRASMLANRQLLQAVKHKTGVIINVPDKPLDQHVTVIKLELKGPLNVKQELPK
ncbi:MAG: alpha-L-fucosidase, partial [Sedimentisphaerales bacterium]|nr:alpha-L-fucosidase [Sedimentisphaerales bacterium]